MDAMVQWWYGHNAVGFLLTAGFLGMMYYFVPKQAGRPVCLYRSLHRALLGADLPSISGPVRTTCTIPPCLTGPSRWAW